MNKLLDKFIFLLPLSFGFLAFYLIIGPLALDVSNIAWIKDDDQWDIYLGTVFFQNSEWTFPIGLNPNFGLQIGSSIAFNASGIALISKIFAHLFTPQFQLVGYWLLCCFVLQAWFSWRLLGIFTNDVVIKILSLWLFVFSPPMLMRIDLHVILVAHFLILWSLVLCLDKDLKAKTSWKFYWFLLLGLAVSIHFYIFFIVGLLWCAALVSQVLIEKKLNPIKAVLIILMGTILVGLIAWQVGYFVIQTSSSAEYGFGFFRAHLLSFIDPAGWSQFFSAIPTSKKVHGDFNLSQGTYEGLAYLGLGNILLLSYAIYKLIKGEVSIKKLVSNNILILISAIILLMFSWSNNLTLVNWNLHIALPDFFISIAGILRSSGRMIWLAWYCLVLFGIYVCVKYSNKKFATLFLFLCATLQFIDTSAGWLKVREQFQSVKFNAPDRVLRDEFWKSAHKNYSYIYQVPLGAGLKQRDWLIWSYYSANHGMSTNAVYQGRVDKNKVAKTNEAYDKEIYYGTYDKKALYIIDDDYVGAVSRSLDPKADLFAKIDGFNVLAPGWNQCEDCYKVPAEYVIQKSPEHYADLDVVISFGSESAGVNYLQGIGQAQRFGWGWSYPEKWGVWSEGRQAKIIIPIKNGVKPNVVSMDIRALILPNHPTQIIDILINGEFSRKLELSKPEYKNIEINIPDKPYKNYILIDFRFKNPISTEDLGVGDDRRKLAIGLETLRIRAK